MSASMRAERALAIVLIVIGALLIVVGVVAPSGHFGMNDGTSYSGTNLFLIMAGVVMVVIGVVLLFIKVEAGAPQQQKPVLKETPPPIPTGPEVQGEPQSAEEEIEDLQSRDELVLRLLTGDERVLYKTIVDSGGTALQKDLIVKTKMSDAKVSRTIDKLIEKGLVKKERYGVTNRITTTPGETGPQ